MARELNKKRDTLTFTIGFCILAIFISITIIIILLLKFITHTRYLQTMRALSFELMTQVTTAGYRQLLNRANNIEMIDQQAAALIDMHVVDPENLSEIVNYTSNLMLQQSNIFSAIESVEWVNVNGNYVFSQKLVNKNILTIVKNDKDIILYKAGKIKLDVALQKKYIALDPRTFLWFRAAKDSKKTIWLDVYPYKPSNLLGISVATPIFSTSKMLKGVFNVNIRLDYLRSFIESLPVSQHGKVFIVSRRGKMVAFPQLVQVNSNSLASIHDLKNYPWIIKAFELYKQNPQSIFVFNYQHKNYIAAFKPASFFPGDGWLLGAVSPEDDFVGNALIVHWNTMAISLSVLIFGIILMSILIARFVKPLKKIAIEIEKIKDFQLKETPPIASRIREIRAISNEISAMKKNLASFQKYVPSSLVKQLIATGEVAKIGGTKKPLVFLFSDIEKFTSIAETMPSEILSTQMADYFDTLSQIITNHHGTIDKYIGDAIMAFWGAPMLVSHPGMDAANSALESLKQIHLLNMQWEKEQKPVLKTRMGIHMGEALVGNFGSSDRLNYTAIGDSVNTASRLVDINKIYGTEIIISDVLYQIIKDHYECRLIDLIVVKGRKESNYIYELLGTEKEQLSFDITEYNKIFVKGFRLYQSSRWEEALKHFSKCLQIYPEDSVAIIFINRIQQYKINPPAQDWNGIYQISEK